MVIYKTDIALGNVSSKGGGGLPYKMDGVLLGKYFVKNPLEVPR